MKPVCNNKSLRLTALLLITPLFFFGQSLTGLWVGSVHNDSATVRKDQSFEIALTEYRGKVYGYSRSEFIVNDTLYYIVKRVKGTIEGDVCEVNDDEIIAYNFRGKLDKGIKVTSTFRRNKGDSAWYLDGTWKTNATKRYYSITGKVGLEEEKDLTASKIFPHLEELKLANDVAFYKEREEGTPIVKIAKPEKIKTEYAAVPETPSSTTDLVVAQPQFERAESIPVVKKAESDLPKTDTKNIPSSTIDIKPAAAETKMAVSRPPADEAKTKNEVAVTTGDTKTPDAATADKNVASNNNVSNSDRSKVTVNNQPATVTQLVTNNATNQVTGDNKMTAQSTTPVPDNKTNNVAANKTAMPATVKTNQPIANNSPQAGTVITKQEIASGQPEVKKTAATEKTVSASKENNTTAKTNIAAGSTQPANSPVTNQGAQHVTSDEKIIAGVKAPEKRETAATPVIERVPVPAVDITQKASLIAGRKSEFTQVVNFRSDSLELALYDNGEIDGDTVSLFLNGEVIMAKQGLKASAIKKTIYINPGNEDFTLVLFAENLGKYPPNTGLLVVHDGEDVYNLRFSSDFQKSTGIVFRRKK
ncbi:MAG TPA: hypothetical protein VFV31_08890 [Chitinophagaceae bacterium]|nr:hypothetical protein [Chitinophagaceae bacterium]